MKQLLCCSQTGSFRLVSFY